MNGDNFLFNRFFVIVVYKGFDFYDGEKKSLVNRR